MESFARIIADHITRADAAATLERAEAAEERLRTRAMFLAMAEHQLKTPLTPLMGTSATLLDKWADTPDSTKVELLAAVVGSARRLEGAIDDLLVEARADNQALEVSMRRVEVGPFVELFVQAFGSVSPRHEILLDVQEGIAAWTDPALLYQVLGHLLDNALKYSPDGGTVWIRSAATEKDVEIEIADEGVGLPKGIDVFEPFSQAAPRDGAGGGIGLGLHIVRTLVEAMRGSVTARPNEDRGATFAVRVPRSR